MKADHDSPLLTIEGISKRYGAVQALSDVSLSVRGGEVLGLVGENGAGKSTLIRIVAGALRPDSGKITLDGLPYVPQSPTEARRAGVAVIHQELALCQNVSVAENIRLGQLPANRLGWVNRRILMGEAKSILTRLGLGNLDPRTPVDQLTPAQRQMVEIARALGSGARFLLMDEPTSSLSGPERDLLLDLVRQLAAENVAIIYISHNLDEVMALCHRVVVFRDGRVAHAGSMAGMTRRELVWSMVGREVNDQPSAAPDQSKEPLLVVRRLTRTGSFMDIDLKVSAGEIVGIAGLVGSGRSEFARALMGVDPATSGEIRFDGKIARVQSPAEAMELGIGLVPEDRREQGAFFNLSVRENITQANLRRYSKLGWIFRRKEAEVADEQIKSLRIKAPNPEISISALSGGNQQKAIIARWLIRRPRLLILDEPTRGIDVGSKQEIHALVRRMAGEGMAVILISSELPEVISLSHRIMVFRGGRVTGELPAMASERSIMSLAM